MKRLIHIYTGQGKGKTTASLGLALRALGQGLSVYMIQFLKSGDTGELFAVKKHLPNMTIAQFGKDALTDKQSRIYEFTPNEEIKINNHYRFPPDEEEREPSRRALEHAQKIIQNGHHDLVILDEINYALNKKLIPLQEVLQLLKNKPEHVEIILTGRNAPPQLLNHADLVTEMKQIKHYFDQGIDGRKELNIKN